MRGFAANEIVKVKSKHEGKDDLNEIDQGMLSCKSYTVACRVGNNWNLKKYLKIMILFFYLFFYILFKSYFFDFFENALNTFAIQ